ncbi:MAG TPA: ATP-dependent DNA helicase, partial [Ktedonobacterales bacterium]
PQALPNDTRGRIAADHDRCAWRDCPHFSDCYVREVRDRAQSAQVVVINHTLLLIDAAMGGFLLPERDVIVVDEAHHLEEEATRAFTVTITPGRIQSLVAQSRVRQHADQGALQEALAASTLVAEALAQIMASNSKGRRTLDAPLQEGLRLASAVDGIANSLQHNRPLNLDAREEQLYERLVKRARTLASDLRTVFSLAEPETRVYYLERVTGRRNDRSVAYSASSTPLSVADLLREKLFDRTPTVITSATIAVGRDFSFFKARTGLSNPREAVLPLTFDYEHDALLYLPKLTHEPAFGAASALYHDELAKHMLEMIAVSSGRAFLLFTSNYALRAVHDRMAAHPDAAGYTFLVQGDGLSRSEMVRQFQKRARPVLFGLRSFWEGVDVPGEALSLVVIDKLPFDPPDDPVNEARVDHMKRAGENWFGGYVLPLATIRLKQGLGRLLRTHADRGVLAILDKRLVTKSYGRQVLAALPPARRTTDLAEVQAFFQRDD